MKRKGTQKTEDNDPRDYPVLNFSEELSDGGERNEMAEAQLKRIMKDKE